VKFYRDADNCLITVSKPNCRKLVHPRVNKVALQRDKRRGDKLFQDLPAGPIDAKQDTAAAVQVRRLLVKRSGDWHAVAGLLDAHRHVLLDIGTSSVSYSMELGKA
jgi:hypothetical protein